MKRFTMFACLTMALVFALGSFAGEMPKYVDGDYSVINGGNLDMSKAARDTFYLIGPWGSGAVVNGEFETAEGSADWNGWTSIDLTQKTEPVWHVDTYNVVAGVYSAWCGDISYDACTETDAVGGYGPSYNEYLALHMIVGNTGASATVTVDATVNHNTEPGYDISNLGYFKADAGIEYLWSADGEGEAVVVTGSVTYQVGEYVGETSNEVHIVWHVTSDGGWDDADCSYYGDGALQVDNITVTVVNDGTTTSDYEDFEGNNLGDWIVEYPVGVGDYAHLQSQLGDEDPCTNDYSVVACFMADDIMFQAGGNPVEYCVDWCYGPGGYIVTTSGGFAGPASHIYNAIESPAIAWPEGDYLGVEYRFDVYRHEDLSADSSGTFYTWGIASTDDQVANPIEDQVFEDRNFVYYGGPDYGRPLNIVTDLVVAGRTFVKVQLAVYELGHIWGWDGDDGYPAPYFDNVRLVCYPFTGPGMASRELDLAQDVFPSIGHINPAVLGDLSCRFDMANNISLATDLQNDPGDSVVFDITAVRTNSTLVTTGVDAPIMHFTIKLNATFGAALRLGVGPFTVNAGADGELQGEITDDGSVSGTMVGSVYGAPAMANGVPSPDRWMFDLPDGDEADAMLYPGDVLHYYFVAYDDCPSAGEQYQSASLPANTAGYGDFSGYFAYNSTFVVRCLPTIEDASGTQPKILFWNDFANRGGEDEWVNAFANIGFYEGAEFDHYYTNAPSSAVSNGLGGRAAYGQLYGYDTMVYTCGDLGMATISNLDYDNDAGDDVGVLDDWLAQGDKYLFMTGDELIMDLNQSGATTTAFLTSWVGVQFQSYDLRPLVGGDTAPEVHAVPGNSVFETTEGWIAYGGCGVINSFDAVTVTTAEQLAYFNDGSSGLSAASKNVAANGSTVVSMPYDFKFIRTLPVVAKANQPAPLPARARLLGENMEEAGNPLRPAFATGANLPGMAFNVNSYPNPFNPVTKIEFTMPKAGHLSLKVFNVRGELVKTLINEVRESSGHVMWDGTSDQGQRVSSGVYFYEARTNGEVKVNKMALVK